MAAGPRCCRAAELAERLLASQRTGAKKSGGETKQASPSRRAGKVRHSR
ncbi:MAG TPA: hypothetical protein VEH31_37925 [Streptosporangiaceae bacterium]|nr:hypothetical protein [Streptosporangiaceae bacterium]